MASSLQLICLGLVISTRTRGLSALIKAPCDIFASGNTPCVAAHSTVRTLFADFNGLLYQVQRQSDNQTLNISVQSTGGFADSSSQDHFCEGTECVISRIYDQSPYMNHLDIAPAGQHVRHPDDPVNASRLSLRVNGNLVYGAYFEGGMGYRIDETKGVATGNDPETIYMVVSGTLTICVLLIREQSN